MIESEFLVYLFIASGVVILICLGAFLAINLKGLIDDEKMYREKTDPRELVSKYKIKGKMVDNEPDPVESLKRYAVRQNSEAKLDSDEEEKIEELDSETSEPEDSTTKEVNEKEYAPPWLKK